MGFRKRIHPHFPRHDAELVPLPNCTLVSALDMFSFVDFNLWTLGTVRERRHPDGGYITRGIQRLVGRAARIGNRRLARNGFD